MGPWNPAAPLPEPALDGTARTPVSLPDTRVVFLESVRALARTIERRDPYTAGHQRRVADLSTGIARVLGMSSDEVFGIRLAAMVLDIGKLFVPIEVLNHPGNITPLDFDLIRTHPRSGHDLLADIPFPWPVARMVLEHHERMDGSGYPQGLRGDEVCPGSRILAVADVVDAITSDRPYRRGLGIQAAIDEIRDRAGTAYDPDVVAACLAHVSANRDVFADRVPR